MATRKKKKTEVIMSAEVAESLNVISENAVKETKKAIKKAKVDSPIEAKIVKGSHLTVITDSNGKTTLEWDDEALARDVREAIEAYELGQLKPAVKAKVASRKKKNLVE